MSLTSVETQMYATYLGGPLDGHVVSLPDGTEEILVRRATDRELPDHLVPVDVWERTMRLAVDPTDPDRRLIIWQEGP